MQLDRTPVFPFAVIRHLLVRGVPRLTLLGLGVALGCTGPAARPPTPETPPPEEPTRPPRPDAGPADASVALPRDASPADAASSDGPAMDGPPPDAASADGRPDGAPASLLETLIADMIGMHDARPNGVPTNVGWAKGPRVGMGNDAGTWTAATAWGQVYIPVDGNTSTNTRVAIREMRMYMLSKATRTWRRIQGTPSVNGAAYREDFAGDVSVPADLRNEATGGVAVKLIAGHNFHFWPKVERVMIDPRDIGGLVVTFQARLVVDDPTKPDDRATARFLAGAGGDYWESMTAKWDNWKTNGDFAIGKLRFVQPEWQTFSAHTLTAADLRATPPPAE